MKNNSNKNKYTAKNVLKYSNFKGLRIEIEKVTRNYTGEKNLNNSYLLSFTNLEFQELQD